MTHEQLGWLRHLIVAYEAEHLWTADEDADATRTMLSACRTLASELGEWLPPEEPREEVLPVADDGSMPY